MGFALMNMLIGAKIVAAFALLMSAFAATIILVVTFFQNIKDDAEEILLELEDDNTMVNCRYIPKHVAECRKCGFCFLCDCTDHMHLIGRTDVECSGCISEANDPSNQATITVTQTVQ